MTTRGERRRILLLGWMMLSGATGPGMATPPRASAASSLVLEHGLLSGRAAGDTPAEVMSLVARAGGVAVRWAGSPGCGPRTVELAGAPVDEALRRFLGREGRSYGLRFRRPGAGEALAEVVVFSESTPAPPCPARADDGEPVAEGAAVGSPPTWTDVARRPARQPDPGAEDATIRELLDVLAHDGDAGVRTDALERIFQVPIPGRPSSKASAIPTSRSASPP